MKIHKILNEVFSSRSHIAVLRVLHFHKAGITGRETAGLAGISPKSALIALTRLEQLKLVNRVIGGRDHHFTLNRENYLVKNGIIPLLKSETDFLNRVLTLIIKEIRDLSISIVLFGSVARGEETSASDLDIFIITNNKKSGNEILKKIKELRAVIEKEFGIHLSPLIYTKEKFLREAKSNSPIIETIKSEGRLLHGIPVKGIINGA